MIKENPRSLFHKGVDQIHYLLGESALKYRYPINPREGEKLRFWGDSPAHTGPFYYALDIIVPDPTQNPLPVIAPASGVIIELVQDHSRWGNGPEFNNHLNFITVLTGESGEFYQIRHIGKNSCPFSVGDFVKKEEQIATTGANGWMSDIRHLHIMVGLGLPGNKDGFRSLRIRWQN